MNEDLRKIQLYIDKELLRAMDAEVKKQGMNRSEFMRLAIQERISNDAAAQGVDSTMKHLRKLLDDVMGPQFNRLAKMIAKDTKASATSMYMNTVLLGALDVDAVSTYQESEKKAALYLTSKE